MDWRSRAACLDKDPELFFPVGNTGPALLQIEEAKTVCRSCRGLSIPVRIPVFGGAPVRMSAAL